ncbi:Inner membrane ABC transporter permease protein YcjO [compost metagenome]
MQNISKDITEAAKMDGVNGWTYFTKIMVPIVSPMVYMVMILSTISAFHAFDVFLVMLGEKGDINAVHDRNMVPNILIYRDAFLNAKMGTASAWAWGLFGIILAVTLFQKKMEKRWVHYE